MKGEGLPGWTWLGSPRKTPGVGFLPGLRRAHPVTEEDLSFSIKDWAGEGSLVSKKVLFFQSKEQRCDISKLCFGNINLVVACRVVWRVKLSGAEQSEGILHSWQIAEVGARGSMGKDLSQTLHSVCPGLSSVPLLSEKCWLSSCPRQKSSQTQAQAQV